LWEPAEVAVEETLRRPLRWVWNGNGSVISSFFSMFEEASKEAKGETRTPTYFKLTWRSYAFATAARSTWRSYFYPSKFQRINMILVHFTVSIFGFGSTHSIKKLVFRSSNFNFFLVEVIS